MLLHLDLLLDARFGRGQLSRSPLVATVAALTLAIGIGLNTAVFSLVNAVLLRPLPYSNTLGARRAFRESDCGFDQYTCCRPVKSQDDAGPQSATVC